MMSDDQSKPNEQDPPQEELIVGRVVDDESQQTENQTDAALSETAIPDAGLADAATEGEIRVGSPFRVDPSPISGTVIHRARAKPEAFYDVGPLRYTAMGAVGAAMLVLGFAAVAAWWFPGGGTIIATLGCALSIFGLYSQRRLAATACLLLHLMLFMISYSRAIEV